MYIKLIRNFKSWSLLNSLYYERTKTWSRNFKRLSWLSWCNYWWIADARVRKGTNGTGLWQKKPYTTSSYWMLNTTIQEHIRKQIAHDLEQFGKVRHLKMRPRQSGCNRQKIHFERATGYFAITFLKNTEQSGQPKQNLVKVFFEMREELSKFRMQGAKAKKKHCMTVLRTGKQAPKHAHSTMNNLLHWQER